MSAKGSGHMNASSLVALVSGLFVFAVCWNLSQLQSKMDERILQGMLCHAALTF